MPTVNQIRTYLAQTILPVLAGAASNWLIIHVHLLATFHIGASSVASAITQLGVFVIGAALAWLTGHHILKGSYEPPAPPAPPAPPPGVK